MKIMNILPLVYVGAALMPTVAYSAKPSEKALLAQTATQHIAQIAQVESGTLKTAYASWWGFNREDATECLQNAINSGVPELIVDSAGSDWIIGKPLTLLSNQQIIFNDGVVIQAKKGAFRGKKEALFTGEHVSNVSLIGQGKVLFRMHRDDYANPKLYEKAEWRHGISFRDSSDIILRNITVAETGGDGLYLGASGSGYNKNVLVENMIFDKNYRQGISVISAENLTIRNCKLTNTGGTAPEAGIDFEPNHDGQRLVNIKMDNCVITGNTGNGVELALFKLNHTSKPISITIVNSLIKGNARGLIHNPYNLPTSGPVAGSVTVENSTFDHNVIYLTDPIKDQITFLFKDCFLDYRKTTAETDSWYTSPIALVNQDLLEDKALGNIVFDNVSILSDGEIEPVSIAYIRGATLSNSITGDIYIQQEKTKTKYDLGAFIHKKQNEFKEYNALKIASVDLQALQPPANPIPRDGNNRFYLRNKFTFLQYAEKGKTVTINIRVGKIRARETTVNLLGPDGETVGTYSVPYNNKPFPITFTAQQTGIYRIVRDQSFSQYIDITSDTPGNGLLVDTPLQFLPKETGRLYFEVPKGVKDFNIGVSSSANVALLDPDGNDVERNKHLGSFQIFVATRKDASQSEIWSIEVSDATWDATVSMFAPLIPIVSTSPGMMLRVK